MTKFILDSGDPEEFREISALAKQNNSQLWGATTNPTLIAKKLSGPSTELRVNKKVTQKEAFELQRQIVLDILNIVPGAVSAEVYADEKTTAEEMIEQGREIITWHERVVVKLPTTIEGFKARTALRKEKVFINNTLVFSQQQIFAICLHEQILQNQFGPIENKWPSFISPFVGRLDDIGEDGMALVEQGMKIKKLFNTELWILEASVRRTEHIALGLKSGTELLTAPAKAYREWFTLTKEQRNAINLRSYAKDLKIEAYWDPPEELRLLDLIDAFTNALESGKLNIHHHLTDKGIIRFAEDWKAIIA